jgi:hypothetical protein
MGRNEHLESGLSALTVLPEAVGEFRRRQAERPHLPYERLMPEDRPSRRIVERFRTEGWVLGNLPAVPLELPLAWDEVCAEVRSWAFHLHSWDPLGPFLAVHELGSGPAELRFAVDVALDWIRAFPTREVDSPWAWYDMAVGLRAYRLAFMIDAACRDPAYRDDELKLLLGSVWVHRLLLADEAEFQGHNNHGFFQAAGQLALARRLPDLPGIDQDERQARDRMASMVANQFSRDRVHLEHSPGYHQAVLGAFERIVNAGLIADPSFEQTRGELEDSMAWFVHPDGSLALIGDTDPKLRLPAELPDLASDHLRFVATDGEQGRLPPDQVRAFPEAGYVVFRAPPANAANAPFHEYSHLVQTAAFHSRTHKHADDLSFSWWDRGRELLSDAGRYGYLGKTVQGDPLWTEGYYYSDPGRVFVESTAAHNALEVDGRSYQRKGARPYGSALTRWGERDGLLFSEAIVRHWRTILHTRLLLLDPGRWLIVLDAVADTAKEPHDFAQRFQFAPGLEMTEADAVAFGVDAACALYVCSLLPCESIAPVRGQEHPRWGWVSRQYAELEPTWACGFVATNSVSHVFATLFSLSDVAPQVDEDCRANISGRKARLTWRIGKTRNQLDIDRSGDHVVLARRSDP